MKGFTLTIKVTPLLVALFAVLTIVSVILWAADGLFTELFGGTFGLITVALVGFLGNLTIVLPVPAAGVTMPFLVTMSDQSGSLFVAGIYALGSAFGETSGYILGRTGKSSHSLGNSKLQNGVEKLIRAKQRFVTDIGLAFLSAFPMLLPFDVGGMIAGSMKHPYWRFIISTFAGRWVKYIVFIWLWRRATNLAALAGWITFGVLVAAGLFLVWWYRKEIRVKWRETQKDGVRLEFWWGRTFTFMKTNSNSLEG